MTYLTSPVANNPGVFSISGLNDDTGWFVYGNIVEDIGFDITGTWVGTITLQTSNETTFVKTRTSTITTYTANQEPLNIPRETGRYFRFKFTAWTSGTAYVGLTQGRDTNGAMVDVAPQGLRSGGN